MSGSGLGPALLSTETKVLSGSYGGLSRRNIRDIAASLKTPQFSVSNRRCKYLDFWRVDKTGVASPAIALAAGR